MNRIRKISGQYQVLVGPSTDYVIGGWMDPFPHQFSVEIYDYLEEAQVRALDLPEMNWSRMVEIHECEFKRIAKEVKAVLDKGGFTYNYYPKLKTPDQVKNKFFDTVLTAQESGQNVQMSEQISDVMTIIITNPWSKNLKEMTKNLKFSKKFEIFNAFIVKNKIIHLQARSRMDTPYEIQLWPNLLYHWKMWEENNYHKLTFKGHQETSLKLFDEALKKQDMLDDNFRIR